MAKKADFRTTAEIKLSPKIIDQVIGQDDAVRVIKKASAQRRHVLLIGEPGTGKCVGKDTLISSDLGLLRAEELFSLLEGGARASLYSINEDGKVAKSRVLRAYKGERKQCLKIRTNSGSEVVLSGEHPVLTMRNGELCFLPAGKLKSGTWVGKARALPSENRVSMQQHEVLHSGKNGVRSLSLNVPPSISKDLAYFLGLYAAEGYYDGTIKIYNRSREVKDSVRKAVISSFNYPSDYFCETDTGIAIKRSRTLAKLLNEQFDVSLVRKKQSSRKQVPQKIFSSTKEMISSYLSGYLDGDGHIGDRGLEFTTASRTLAIGLQTLLLKLGVQSRLRKVHKCATNMQAKIKRQYFSVHVYDSENLRKLDSLDLKIKYKRLALKQFAGKKDNTNVDLIPGISDILVRPKEVMGVSFEDIGIGHQVFTKLNKGIRLPSRKLTKKLFELYDEHLPSFLEQNSVQSGNGLLLLQESEGKMKELESLMQKLSTISNSDIFWDKVESIENVSEEVYDFEVERYHNFIVDSGIVVHNSMLGLALAELLPKEKLVDVVAFPNPNDENQPLIRTLPAGEARDLINKAKIEGMNSFRGMNLIMIVLLIASFIAPIFAFNHYSAIGGPILGGIMFFAFMVGFLVLLVAFVLFINMGRRQDNRLRVPKLLVDNYRQKTAPFHDATGAHAGALLGDVLHDPFQCFIFSNIYVEEYASGVFKAHPMPKLLDALFLKHMGDIIKNENGYEAIFLEEGELRIIGHENDSLSPVEVLSCNRQDYCGEVIKLTTSGKKELIVTPEHKIAIAGNRKISYVAAKDLKIGDALVAKDEDVIIDEQNIINTYDKWQQEQCRLYKQHLEIRALNPGWGYKKIAKAINQPIGKTRWWHAGRHIPVPIQTANWLKERGLLPLRADNPKLPLIAKIIGASFGDGGIFENMNGIFLSSSEREATEEFGRDIELIFGLSPDQNSRIIEGGEKGHSWCYQNTNRNVIRFFLSLGAPKGNKTNIELNIPEWIYMSDDFADEFFGSFLGSEVGAPKVHKQGNRLQTLDVAITGPERLEDNRTGFLNGVKAYLEGKNVMSTSLTKRTTKNERLLLYRLLLSTKFDNMLYFMMNVKLNYCKYKTEKIYRALGEFAALKKEKYRELLRNGYGAESAMNLLKLSPDSLYLLLNHFGPEEAEAF